MLNRTAYDRFANGLTEQQPTGFDFIFISRNVEQSVRVVLQSARHYMWIYEHDKLQAISTNTWQYNSIYFKRKRRYSWRRKCIYTKHWLTIHLRQSRQPICEAAWIGAMPSRARTYSEPPASSTKNLRTSRWPSCAAKYTGVTSLSICVFALKVNNNKRDI